MTEEREMMFVVYRKTPCVVYSIHRTFEGAHKVKRDLVEAGEDQLNIETYGMYVKE
jgi:hypothetical protein